mgnify:CR=1 FL=1
MHAQMYVCICIFMYAEIDKKERWGFITLSGVFWISVISDAKAKLSEMEQIWWISEAEKDSHKIHICITVYVRKDIIKRKSK